MLGTWVNTGTVIVGSLIGMSVGDRLPDRFKRSVITALGLVTIWIGVQMVIKGTRPLLIVVSIVLGGIVGEMIDIERRLELFAEWLKQKVSIRAGENFVTGFVTASLLFCVGPMTLVGSIEDGMTGDATLLLTKSVMDGFASIALAAATGIGVLFSAGTVLAIQGGLTLLGQQLSALTSPDALNQLSCVGGLIILALGIRMLELRKIPVANYLPALVFIAVAVTFW